MMEADDKKSFYNSLLTDCLYSSDNLYDIPNLLIEKQARQVILPIAPWGADSRSRTGIATYHF